jgi:hypothetical protein
VITRSILSVMPLAPEVPPSLDARLLERVTPAVAESGGITFLVDGGAVTYVASDAGVRAEEGRSDGATAVRMSPQAWSDLVGQVRTFVGLFLGDELTFERGGFAQLSDWDPILKYVHAGIPPYDPTATEFGGRSPSATFPAETDDAELAAQLTTMGVVHVTGVFTAEEMRAANDEIDRLAALARPDDDESWWATAEGGSRALCRLVYASQRSAVLAELEQDPRVRRFGTLLAPNLRVAADRMEGTAVLLKVPGKTSGLSNIPWHQDCGVGGHGLFCPSVGVGIQITGSDASTGNLLVVPGSHGQTLPYGWEERYDDVPVVSIDTAPGDVTIHVKDVMHASPPPTGDGGRRTMYVTHYPPSLWEYIGPRQAFNDLVRHRTEQVGRLQHRRGADR